MDKLEKAKKERTKVAIQNQKSEMQGFCLFPAEFNFVALLFLMNCALCYYCLFFPGSDLFSCMSFFLSSTDQAV